MTPPCTSPRLTTSSARVTNKGFRTAPTPLQLPNVVGRSPESFARVSIRHALFRPVVYVELFVDDSESASDSLARVYNGPSAAEGDLAVTSSEGQLGFLCLPTPSGDPPRPDVNLVSVACRQMGFDAGLAVTPANFYTGGKGKFAHSFVPVSIECIGTETSLDRCRHTALSNTYSCYSGRREAGVICASQEPSEPFLRFWRNRASTSNEGFPFVGVQRVNEWVFGGICDEDGQFGMPEANLVCRQVGFAHGAVEPIKAPFITTTPVYGRTVVVANLKCNASATTLNDCAFKMSDTCGERDWVKLDCAGKAYNYHVDKT